MADLGCELWGEGVRWGGARASSTLPTYKKACARKF